MKMTSDYITQTDPVIGWEAIQPTHPVVEVNPYDAMIERAWQRRDADIDKAFDTGKLDPEICTEWTRVIDYLRYLQDCWIERNEECQTGRPDCSCEFCQAVTRLTYQGGIF
jgi:hypothetical protein